MWLSVITQKTHIHLGLQDISTECDMRYCCSSIMKEMYFIRVIWPILETQLNFMLCFYCYLYHRLFKTSIVHVDIAVTIN